MILYALQCAKDHAFEAWFRDSTAYDELAGKRRLACPVCGSKRVTKAPMAPRLAKGRSAEPAGAAHEGEAAPPPAAASAMPGARKMALLPQHQQMLDEMRKHIESNCDYVGPKFAEEARKIHYGETEKRSIYGEATAEEAEALADEGVEVHSIPWPQRSDA